MPKGLRLTRRFNAAMTESAFRRLRRFAREHGLSENEALTFIFENFDSISDHENLVHRVRLFKAALDNDA